MSNQVDFLPFAIGNSANVLSQSDYAALAAILTGFQSGTAKSAQVNKALRQATVMAAVLANFIANNANVNVLDNGDTGTLLTNFVAALKAANASAGFLNKSNNLSDVLSAATALANLGGLAKSNNLSDLASIPTALANLGLGGFVQDTGAVNAVVIASPVVLADGVPFLVKFAAANTGATTIKIGSAAAIPLIGVVGALQGGEISAGGYGWVAYSSTLASAVLLSPVYGGALQIAPATKSEHAVQLGQFSSLRSGTGYRKLPDGTIKMWGIAITASLASGSQAGWSVSLPTAFPNYMLCASACIANGALSNGSTTSIMDVGTPFTGTADTALPKAAATTISGVAINASGTTTKLLIRWECEGY